jgi:hypothetical protein
MIVSCKVSCENAPEVDLPTPESFSEISAPDIDGFLVHFDEEFEGRVVLITNVASQVRLLMFINLAGRAELIISSSSTTVLRAFV